MKNSEVYWEAALTMFERSWFSFSIEYVVLCVAVPIEGKQVALFAPLLKEMQDAGLIPINKLSDVQLGGNAK